MGGGGVGRQSEGPGGVVWVYKIGLKERQTERQRQTDSQTQTDTQTHREVGGGGERERERETPLVRKGGGGERPVVSFIGEPTRAWTEERETKGGSISQKGRGASCFL